MNDTTVERFLFQAPKPAAPAELLKALQAEIHLPAAKTPAARKNGELQSPMKRWFPALAFCLLMLSCAIMIAVQGSQSASLKRQNEVLQKATAALPQLREQHAALEQALAQQDELNQLRKDNEEMHRLQAEMQQLQQMTAQVQRLKGENARLSQSLNAPTTPVNVDTFFDEAQQRAERIQCVNNLKQLGLAMRLWAGDNNDKYPTSLVVMSNELSAVKVLICPGDKARQANGSLLWSQFQDNMTSYQYLAQPDDEQYPECITAFCPIHHNYLLADGSVQSINPSAIKEVKKDGRWYLQPINANSGR